MSTNTSNVLTTWGIDNVRVPAAKGAIIDRARKAERDIIDQWTNGFLSQDEKYQKVIEIWEGVKKEIEKALNELSAIRDQAGKSFCQ